MSYGEQALPKVAKPNMVAEVQSHGNRLGRCLDFAFEIEGRLFGWTPRDVSADSAPSEPTVNRALDDASATAGLLEDLLERIKDRL